MLWWGWQSADRQCLAYALLALFNVLHSKCSFDHNCHLSPCSHRVLVRDIGWLPLEDTVHSRKSCYALLERLGGFDQSGHLQERCLLHMRRRERILVEVKPLGGGATGGAWLASEPPACWPNSRHRDRASDDDKAGAALQHTARRQHGPRRVRGL